MKLTVVGCSGSFPGPDSATSCYLVEAAFEGGSYRLLLDLGSGALGPLQRYTDLRAIDAVALTHLHPDHCLDLCGFYVFRKYHPDGPMPKLPVYGPAGAARRLAAAYGRDDNGGVSDEFDFRVFPDGDFALGPYTVSVAPVDHPVTAYALRISEADHTLVYSGDTGPCSALDEIAKGADLLLGEASFLEGGKNPPGLHLTARQVAETASRAGVRRLVLTHVPPWYARADALKEAEPYFAGAVSAAFPGATYDV